MEIPTALIGCQVDRTTFDHQVRLSLSAFDPDGARRVDAELVIERPFLLGNRNGQWHTSDSGTGSALGLTLDLFQRIVTAVDVRAGGALHLAFDEGFQLHIDPHPDYESWSLAGTGVEPVTVGPAGETVWRFPLNGSNFRPGP